MKNPRFHRPAERLASFQSGARFFVVLAAVVALQGCDKITSGVVDPKGQPAFVSAARVSPDSVKLTTLPQSNGVLTVTLNVQARMQPPPPGSPASPFTVQAAVYATDAIDPFLLTTLLDNGAAPDSVAGDMAYSGTMRFGVLKSATGRYRIQVTATTTDGLVSNLLEVPVYMIRNNVAPVLSNLQAPDTVTVPVGGSNIRITLKATDGDGQADIKEVFFQSLDASNPTFKYLLLDDGGGSTGLSGDTVAGDSVYTIIVQVPTTPASPKTFRFFFQASDAFGDTSASILHRVTIR